MPILPFIGLDDNYIIGHNHTQFEIIQDNYKLISVGSVGQNRKNFKKSEFIIYDSNCNLCTTIKNLLKKIDLVLIVDDKDPQKITQKLFKFRNFASFRFYEKCYISWD